MNQQETMTAFLTEWQRRLDESGHLTGYSDCFGAGLLMEELCFGVGSIKLDQMVSGYDDGASSDETDEDKQIRRQEAVQAKIAQYPNFDLTNSFPMDRLRRLNLSTEELMPCDMRMIKSPQNTITAMYWNGENWVTNTRHISEDGKPVLGLLDNLEHYYILGTFRPVNFDDT